MPAPRTSPTTNSSSAVRVMARRSCGASLVPAAASPWLTLAGSPSWARSNGPAGGSHSVGLSIQRLFRPMTGRGLAGEGGLVADHVDPAGYDAEMPAKHPPYRD